MNKGTFFTGQPLFNQVLSCIPRKRVSQIIMEKNADLYYKRFSTYDHLVTLLYAVFNQCNSLREVTTGLLAWEHRIQHLGMKHHPRRSTISDANAKRDPEVFEEIYKALLALYSPVLSDSQKGKLKKLYLFDSTTISLFKEILEAAGLSKTNGKRKGGIKVHTLLRSDQDVPTMVKFSAGKANDAQYLKKVHLPANSVIVFDKGYVDYTTYNRFSNQKITWVTRLRNKMVYTVKNGNAITEHQQKVGVLSDEQIILGHSYNKKAIKVKARLVRFKDAESNKVFEFITNNLRLAPATIAGYYKRRWQIETFFGRIKGNFPLKYFLGDNENAIKLQIWAVLIADLLLKVIKNSSKCRMSFSNLASLVRLHLMTYMDLKSFLRAPEKELLRRIKQAKQNVMNFSLFPT
jgi:hypothetical protein